MEEGNEGRVAQAINEWIKTERPPLRVAVLVCRIKDGGSLRRGEVYRSFLRQLMRSPRVVVPLETGCLWLPPRAYSGATE